jgi:hypothetical protein
MGNTMLECFTQVSVALSLFGASCDDPAMTLLEQSLHYCRQNRAKFNLCFFKIFEYLKSQDRFLGINQGFS